MRNGYVLFAAIVWFACGSALDAQTTNPPPGAASDVLLKKAGVDPIGDWQVDPAQTAYLESVFGQAAAAADAIVPGPDASAERHAIDNLLRGEIESFLATNATSAYAPGLHVLLGHKARMRCGYSLAMEHYAAAFKGVAGSPDPTAMEIALEASGSLAKLLALTGQIAEFDALQAQAGQMGPAAVSSYDWGWADEMRGWVVKHPEETYKCGLYCLDQLGRMTQPGQFLPKNILERNSSTNGFSAAELVAVGTSAGLRVHAALLSSTNALPIPCVLHLRSEHFILLREKRGAFYNVVDLVASGPKWLTLDDLLEELSGCVIVSDATPATPGVSLTTIDSASAGVYRGRCHNPIAADHDNSPPPTTCSSPPGGPNGNNPSGNNQNNSNGNNQSNNGAAGNSPVVAASSGGCSSCGQGGMAGYFVSEPWLNLWLRDIPLSYAPAYGDRVELNLSYTFRRQGSAVSGAFWHGAQFGTYAGGSAGVWSCSWLSFAELSSGDDEVDLMLPAGGWATFAFPSGSNLSTNNFLHNLVLEKQGPSGAITNLVLHYQDGSLTSYGVYDKSDISYDGIFYMTSAANPAGNATGFSYNASHYLTTVTAVDGTSFTLNYTNSSIPSYVTSVSASYGRSVYIGYDLTQLFVTNITDAAGLSSQIQYNYYSGFSFPAALLTPYGTTGFDIVTSIGIFDRVVQITNAAGTIEYYGQLNAYSGVDWPDFATSQIPTNTPVGTLDTDAGERKTRNTFYWNAQQFAPFVNTSPVTFTWANQLKYARIRHWLASSDGLSTHWEALSAEQAPSPGGSTEGEVTFYDYAGKPAGVDYEVGVQVMPSVVARVMPDGSTWCQYSQYLTNGLPTSIKETWVDSGTVHSRSNLFVYAANNIDLAAWTNAVGVRASGNLFNSFHEVVTNYDALGQVTTNGYDGTTHQVTSSQSPSGLVTLYTYNGSHRLTSVVDLPVDRTNSYTWNSDGTMATHTDPRNLVETYFWDGLHRLSGSSDSRGTTTNLYYVLSGTAYPNSSGGTAILDRTAIRDRLGHWTSYVYDPLRRVISETNVNGVVTTYSYCDCGAVSSITSAWGTSVQEVVTNTFDNKGRLIYVNYPDTYNVTNWYDSVDRLIVRGDGAANHWLFYNNLGLLTVRSNAYGAELTQTYDILNRPLYVTDANGVMATNTYDNLNRLLTRGYPDGGVERFGYSAKGLIAYTNQINMTNFYAYDELGRKTFETNGNWEILKYTNNAAGDLLSLTDGKNQTTVWKYDQFGRLTNKLDQASGLILGYFYDSENRLTNRWSAAFGTTYYTNDPVGNLTYIKYPHSTSVSLQYDSLNRLTNMVDAAGTTKYAYTAGNQLLTEVQPFTSSTLTNTYANRLRTAMSLQQPTGLWTNKFLYDSAARLTAVTSPAGTFSYTVGAASPGSALIKKLALPNTSYITNSFDSVARLTGTYLDNSANSVMDSAIYGYNKASQRTAFTNAAGTYYLYTYDRIGQVAVADSSVNTEDRGYFYDAAWNLNRLTNNGTPSTYTVDSKNELTSWVNGANTYDSNGNMTSENTAAITNSYDDENRLISSENDDKHTWRTDFVYDGLGRLRKRIEYSWTGSAWSDSSEAHYVYDGWRVIQERAINNAPTVSYTRGTDLSGTLEGAGGIGGLLARSSGYSSGNWTTNHFYHADGNGNITYLVDSSQALAASYRYDPFGNTMSSSGTLASVNVYRFSSKEFMVNSAKYYYGYRFYDTSLQRWLNRDPDQEWGGINLYGFAYNSPGDLIDSDGRGVIAIPLGGIVIENPVGAALCAGAGVGAALCWAFPDVMTKPGEWIGNLICPMSRGHTKGKRESTRPKHEEGDARRGRDQGGEKGDTRRAPKDPPSRGPKPPKPPYPPNKGPKPKDLSAVPVANRGGEFVLFLTDGSADWEDLQGSVSDLWPKARTPSNVG